MGWHWTKKSLKYFIIGIFVIEFLALCLVCWFLSLYA